LCSCSSRDGLSRLSTSNPLTKLATSATSHLSPSHVDYLIHWTGLLLLEESQTSGPVCQKDLWCLNPQQRYVVFIYPLLSVSGLSSGLTEELDICGSFRKFWDRSCILSPMALCIPLKQLPSNYSLISLLDDFIHKFLLISNLTFVIYY
jgi:hypothetical protein